MKQTKALMFVLVLALFGFPLKGFAETHSRDSWYIGFGLGAGLTAKYTIKDGPTRTFDDDFSGATSKSPQTALNFKVGATLSPKSLLGFDVTADGQTASSAGVDVQEQINNYFLMYTYFPYEEGLFLRLGGGLSGMVSKTPVTTKIYRGFGVLGGIGYAFWLGKSFNLTLNADYSMQSYSGASGEPSQSQFAIVYLGFDWY